METKGTGTLYVREELLQRLWVNMATTNLHDFTLKAYRFSTFGTSNLSVMVGLKAALDFFEQIGAERIYARQHQLATLVRDRMAAHPQVKVVNASADPKNHEFFGALVSFEQVPTVLAGATTGGLKSISDECAAMNVRLAGGAERIRIATNIFTLPTELNAFFDPAEAVLGG